MGVLRSKHPSALINHNITFAAVIWWLCCTLTFCTFCLFLRDLLPQGTTYSPIRAPYRLCAWHWGDGMDAILPAAGLKGCNTLVSLPRAKLERSRVSDQTAAQTIDTDDQRLQDCVPALVVCITVGPQEIVLSTFLFTLDTFGPHGQLSLSEMSIFPSVLLKLLHLSSLSHNTQFTYSACPKITSLLLLFISVKPVFTRSRRQKSESC